MAIHRWLIEQNLRGYRPLRHMPLTPTHYRVRLQRCLARSGWNHAEWGRMVFSDESRFQLCPDDHRSVWRWPGQRADPAFTIACHSGPQPGVMVWGAIYFDSRTPLVVIGGTFTAQLYVDDILRTVLIPFLLQYPGLIFQQDNTKPHTARVAMNCLTACQTLPFSDRYISL
ncbi:transposable element Tc1 transposase [Trichonephila clavipes]|nr:transposable element Tc1 transposase [Trichonephila clavipes]